MPSSRKGTTRTTASVSAGLQLQEMIQGIRLQVRGSELAVRLDERIRWHRARNDSLIAEMKKLADIERDGGSELATLIRCNESPRATLEKRLREHQERASFLAFLRDHIEKNATYRLDAVDLRMTEILPERTW